MTENELGFTPGAASLVDELIFAAKRLAVEEHNCDEELFDVRRLANAKVAVLDYISALNEEINELGDVAKGCARREMELLPREIELRISSLEKKGS